jgi:hypothetical protein
MDEGGKISDFNFTIDSHNITEAMDAIRNWIVKSDGYKSSYEYEQLMKNLKAVTKVSGLTEDDGASLALRLFIHYAGDIHQPLHAASRVDKEYPQGDRGGNNFRLPLKDQVGNLHAAYDSVFWEYTGRPVLPLTADKWTIMSNSADKLMTKYPKDQLFDLSDPNFNNWAIETLQIVDGFTYKEINHKEGQALPDDYIKMGITLTERQLVTGGYRLSNILSAMFADSDSETVVKALEEKQLMSSPALFLN